MARRKGYKIIKKWNKKPVYGCDICSFESLKESVVADHVIMVHSPRRQPKDKPQFDRFGVPVRTQVEAPMKKGV